MTRREMKMLKKSLAILKLSQFRLKAKKLHNNDNIIWKNKSAKGKLST